MTEEPLSSKTIEDIERDVLFHALEERLSQDMLKRLEKLSKKDRRHERKMARIEKENDSLHMLIGVVFIAVALTAIILSWTWNARENNHERHLLNLERERTIQLCMENGGDPLYCEEAST